MAILIFSCFVIFGFLGLILALLIWLNYLIMVAYGEDVSKRKTFFLITLNLMYGIPCMYKVLETMAGW